MLILNREVGQSIIIDGDIIVKILSNYQSIRVGIQAPEHITILRKEILNKGIWKTKKGILVKDDGSEDINNLTY